MSEQLKADTRSGIRFFFFIFSLFPEYNFTGLRIHGLDDSK